MFHNESDISVVTVELSFAWSPVSKSHAPSNHPLREHLCCNVMSCETAVIVCTTTTRSRVRKLRSCVNLKNLNKQQALLFFFGDFGSCQKFSEKQLRDKQLPRRTKILCITIRPYIALLSIDGTICSFSISVNCTSN